MGAMVVETESGRRVMQQERSLLLGREQSENSSFISFRGGGGSKVNKRAVGYPNDCKLKGLITYWVRQSSHRLFHLTL